MGFVLEDVGPFLEGDAEVDVVGKSTADTTWVGGRSGGWGHVVAHEEGRIILRNKGQCGISGRSFIGLLHGFGAPPGDTGFLRIFFVIQSRKKGYGIGLGPQQAGDLILPEIEAQCGLATGCGNAG